MAFNEGTLTEIKTCLSFEGRPVNKDAGVFPHAAHYTHLPADFKSPPPTLFELAIFAHDSKVNNYTRIDSLQRARLWPETPLREGGEGVHVPFRVRLHAAAQGPRARQVGFPLSLFRT